MGRGCGEGGWDLGGLSGWGMVVALWGDREVCWCWGGWREGERGGRGMVVFRVWGGGKVGRRGICCLWKLDCWIE